MKITLNILLSDLVVKNGKISRILMILRKRLDGQILARALAKHCAIFVLLGLNGRKGPEEEVDRPCLALLLVEVSPSCFV